jgi:hypothetical protein
MTDPTDFDELASAHLDGATDPAEAARVEADPALRARVEELRAVREAVAAVPPVDPTQRDGAIAAAVSAFRERRAASPAGATVTPLPPRGVDVPTTAMKVIGVAAVLLLLALVIPQLFDGTGSDDAAEGAFESTGSAIGDQDGAEAANDSAVEDSGAPTSTTAGVSGTLSDLGDFDARGPLIAAASAARDEGQGEISPSAGFDVSAECVGARVAQASEQASTVTHAWTATLEGIPVVVLVTRSPTNESVAVYDAATCEPL